MKMLPPLAVSFHPSSRARQVLTCLLLFGLAFVPRVFNLTAYVAADEAKWILRSAHFLSALLSGDFGAAASQVATPEVDVLAPGVTTMWAGTLGLLAKYWADGVSLPLLEYLASLPYDHSERVSLDFYPWLRFPTVLIASLFIVAFYLLLRKLLPAKRIALTASIMLALDPFFLNHSRVIHHDALVTIFMSLSLLSLLVCFQQGRGWQWLLLSGVSLGLAALTKPTGLFLVPFAGIMWLWQTYRTRRWGLWGWSVLWAGVGLLTFVIAWPAVWGDPVGTLSRLIQTSLAAGSGDGQQRLIPSLVPGRVPELGLLFYPINWLLRWGILPTLGLGLAPLAWRRGRQPGDDAVKPCLVWLLLFSLLLMLALAPLGTRDVRYYLPAWPALMALAAFGLTWLQRQWMALAVAVLSIGLLIPYYPYYVTYYNPLWGGPYLAPKLVKVGGGEGMDQVAAYLNAQPGIDGKTVVSTMLESFRPYFSGHLAEHRSDAYADVVVNYIRQIQNGNPSDEYLAYFAARVPQHTVHLDGIEYAYIYFESSPRPVHDVSFGDAKLIAQALDARFAQPGQKHDLTLLWRAGATLGSTLVQLQVRDGDGRVWAQGEGPLLSPDGPSGVEGHYALALPVDMPRGDYQLWASVGNNEDWALIGTVSVHQFAPPATLPHALDADFGGFVVLRGFDIRNPRPIPGETVTLDLYWQAWQTIPDSYAVFAHLLDPAGNRVAQSDAVPGNGQWPTNTWEAGEWVTDKISLTLPPELPAGQYRLLLGMYRWDTGERLPVVGDTTGQNAIMLSPIRVQSK